MTNLTAFLKNNLTAGQSISILRGPIITAPRSSPEKEKLPKAHHAKPGSRIVLAIRYFAAVNQPTHRNYLAGERVLKAPFGSTFCMGIWDPEGLTFFFLLPREKFAARSATPRACMRVIDYSVQPEVQRRLRAC